MSLDSLNCRLVDSSMNYGGIYVIYNLFNEKFYIGSSNNVYLRNAKHFSDLRLNKHGNSHLQRSYNKHSEFFITFLLENVPLQEDLLQREQYWLDELHACNDGYNILPIAGRVSGFHHSDETKRKISEKNKGRKASKETILKIRKSRLGYVTPEETKQKLSELHKGLKHTDETKRKISEVQFIPVNQLSLEGKLIKRWESMTTAQNEGGFDKRHISKCCNGIRKTHSGCKWEFANVVL